MNVDPGAVLSSVAASGCRFLRLTWCDNAGLIRAKAARSTFVHDLMAGGGVGIAAAQQAVTAALDAPAPGSGLTPAGEVLLRADWTTFRSLLHAPGHARVLADIYDGDRPWGHCPRAMLRRAIARAADRGLEVLGAFENEFYLLRPEPGGWAPADATLFAQTFALDAQVAVLNAIVEALEAQGIAVELLHAESGPGQFEIPVRYTDALGAADQQIAFRETVRAVAGQHGLIASFLPKVFADQAGSGAHLHYSLRRDGRSVMADPDRPEAISATAASFAAGILDHLPALMALTTPSPISYRRIQPHSWSGAYACWGYANREAAIRVPRPVPGRPVSHLELKTVDATCNPYLALGAVIAAGLDGVDRGLTPGEPVPIDPGEYPESERRSRGIRALPGSIDDALAALEGDAILLEALGPDLARSFPAVRRAEAAALRALPAGDDVRLLLERY